MVVLYHRLVLWWTLVVHPDPFSAPSMHCCCNSLISIFSLNICVFQVLVSSGHADDYYPLLDISFVHIRSRLTEIIKDNSQGTPFIDEEGELYSVTTEVGS